VGWALVDTKIGGICVYSTKRRCFQYEFLQEQPVAMVGSCFARYESVGTVVYLHNLFAFFVQKPIDVFDSLFYTCFVELLPIVAIVFLFVNSITSC